MNTRISKGNGITGAIHYAQGEGRDPVTRQLKKLAPGEKGRVEFFGGVGFFWSVENAADVEHARREMEFDALNQRGQCRQDCVHLMLAWRPGEIPTREHMAEQVKSALAAIGMANAKALYFSHGDEDYRHIHVVASKINPETGYAYDLKGDYLQLSTWAEQYEAEHGGVISVNRATNNELRAAIAAHDAGAVLEAMTKQRATFTPAQLESALTKQIKDQSARAQFTEQILARPEIVRLAEKADGPAVRYSTRAVIEAELHVLRAAAGLTADTTHGIDERRRAAILASDQFRTMSAEQARAFRHVTGAESLALIDGQAGTGKSYTITAVRQAYEAAGCNVIGLGPTNAVAQDMTGDGFGHAATIHSELFALNTGRRNWSAKTVVIVDEAAMIDTKLMAMVTAWAFDSRAKLILVGDDRQLSSIDRGGMFGALKDRYGAAELSEVKRQRKLDQRRASEWMAQGNFHDALNLYDRKGSIHWTRTQGEARTALIAQWAKDSAAQPDKSRFVFAYTNDDVAQLNAALRDVRKERGELGDDHSFATKHGWGDFARGDRILFTGSAKKQGIINGHAGTIEAIDGSHITVTLDGRRAKTVTIDAASFDQFRHAYAATVYKAQGRTLDQTYLYHSEHWRSAASYVALTRHRDKAELFVATNTAADVKQLARQMGRTDDRRAASQFHHAQKIDATPMTAADLHARFSADATPGKDKKMDAPKPAANQNERDQALFTAPWGEPTPPPIRDFRRAEHETTDADQGRISAAWKQPAFSRDTISADPWTAVYLPIPEQAPAELLREARNWVEDLRHYADPARFDATHPPSLSAFAQPLIDPGSYPVERNFAVATARLVELDRKIELHIAVDAARGETLDRRPADERAAMQAPHRPLFPASGDNFRTLTGDEARDVLATWAAAQGPDIANQNNSERIALAAAQETLHAPAPLSASARPETAATATDGPQSGAAAPKPRWEAISPLRRVRHFLEEVGDHVVANVFHFLSDLVSPPPKLTPQQVHDRLQAAPQAGNLEALDAAAAAEAHAQEEADYDWRQMELIRQEQTEDLSLADQFGTPATREATHIDRAHARGRDDDYDYERD